MTTRKMYKAWIFTQATLLPQLAHDTFHLQTRTPPVTWCHQAGRVEVSTFLLQDMWTSHFCFVFYRFFSACLDRVSRTHAACAQGCEQTRRPLCEIEPTPSSLEITNALCKIVISSPKDSLEFHFPIPADIIVPWNANRGPCQCVSSVMCA